MDNFGTSAYGGDGTRDLLSSQDPYSPPYGFQPEYVSRHSLSLGSGSRLNFDNLDLNSNSESLPHLGGYQRFLQDNGEFGPTVGFGPGFNPGPGRGLDIPPVPSRGGLPPQPPRRGTIAATRAWPGRGGAQGPRRSGRRGAVAAAGRGRAAAGTSRHARGKVVIVEDDDAEDTRTEQAWNNQQLHRANWSPSNTLELCKIIAEQKAIGNYVNGVTMNCAYPIIAEKYYAKTGLRHDTGQICNRLSQLKGIYAFIKKIRTMTGLSRRHDGWPNASAGWWAKETKGYSSEIKKLKSGPPPYADLLHDMFHDVVVDGSTSYVPGQEEEEEEEQEQEQEEEEYEEEEEDESEDVQPDDTTDFSHRSSGSHKRATSGSTNATSPSKRSKSPIVQAFNNLYSLNKQVAEHKISFMEKRAAQAAKQQDEMEQKQISHLARVTELALEAGVEKGSREYLALGYLCNDTVMRELFFNCDTPRQRLDFI
ncbi:hypothetical protein QOZ80_1BG0063290 [Eleusine coracana subsp. coracana]|nr:hypothetical protein QOZ80_1BG0063290 [Eleusine coracana subsp. coracana]